VNRRSGLTRHTPLARGKGLAPGERALTSATPLPRTPTAPKPRRPRVAAAVRDAVLARSGGHCEVAATSDCLARGRSLDSHVGVSQHHRRPGRMGGSSAASTNTAANLLHVCGSGTTGCHGAIESNRTEALAFGWLLHAGQDPELVPVRLWNGRRVLLTVAGEYAAPPDAA